jgi:hypothetical protein
LIHDKNPGLIFVELDLHGLTEEIIQDSPEVTQVIELCTFYLWVSDGSPIGYTRSLLYKGLLLNSGASLGLL